MTTHHECRNCRWSVLKFNNEIQCANIRSGKNKVAVGTWCKCWEHERTEEKPE